MTNIENKCLKISCKKKKQVGKFIKDQIEKNKHTEKKPPPPSIPSTTQAVLDGNDVKDWSQMSQEELDDVTHQIMEKHFSFALAWALKGGHDQKELEEIMIKESIK